MFLKLLITCGITLFSALAAATICSNKVGECSYYSCLSDEMSCSSNDYPLKMGKHYCEKFSYYQSTMTEAGKVFVTNLRSCLQEEIESLGAAITCKNIYQYSKQHHIKCYLDNGFCNLNAWDKVIIFGVTFHAISSDRLMKSTAQEINKHCKETL